MATCIEKYLIMFGNVIEVERMTQEELNMVIAEIIIPAEKPKSTGNSHKRKQWENLRNWRLCTIGESCKLGSLKDYEELCKFYDQFKHWIGWIGWICSPGGIFAGVYYDTDRHYFKHHSYNKKWLRNFAERRVRKYKGEISKGGMYRRFFDYQWSCI